MEVNKIQRYINAKTTGYSSACAVGLTIYSGISKNKTIRKTHKPLAYISALTALLHIGLVEYYSYKYKNRSK